MAKLVAFALALIGIWAGALAQDCESEAGIPVIVDGKRYEPGEDTGLPVGDEKFDVGESGPVDTSVKARRQRGLTEVKSSSFREVEYSNGALIKVGAQNLGRFEGVSNDSSREDVKAQIMRVLQENAELFRTPLDDVEIVVDEFFIESDDAKVTGRFRRSQINFHQVVNGIPVADSTITLADDRVSYLRIHLVDSNDNALKREAMLGDEVLRGLAVDEYSRQMDNEGELQIQRPRLVILDDTRSGNYIVVYELVINFSVVRLNALDGSLYDFERGVAL